MGSENIEEIAGDKLLAHITTAPNEDLSEGGGGQ